MSQYKIVESTSHGVENVNRYEDLERHHPSQPELRNRQYDTVQGRREEVKFRDREEIVKDFVLLVNGSDRNVSVPSPFPTSYAHPTHDATNSVFFYDKPFGTPGAQRLGAVLHMQPGSEPKEGARIEYGKPIGIQSDYGAEPGAIHVHLQADLATQKKYISDVAEGRIQTGGVVTATPPTPTGNASPDSGTTKDKLLEKGEDGPGVKRLQEALNAAGITVNGQPLPTTGHFGDQTEAAVKQYQQQKGLEADGRAGKDTLTALGIYPGQTQTTPAPQQQPSQPQQSTQPQSSTQPQQSSQPQSSTQTNPYGFGPDNELGRLIGRGEGSYNSYNRGNAGDSSKPQNLTDLTVGEIMRRQDLSKNDPNYLFAVGKYQFVDDTLKETVAKLGIDKNAKFTPQLQEKMFADYLIDEKRPAVHNYIVGKTGGAQGLHNAQVALSMEFASVGDPDKGGRSHYDKVGNNSASITPKEVQTALDHMREQYQKNVQSGMSADQAYKALSGDPNKYSQTAGATGQTQAPGGGLDDKLLMKGEDGAGVKRLQEALNAAGVRVNGQPLPTTGHFGDQTEAAVKQYQQQKGLEVDGKAGKDTLTALGIYPGQTQTTPTPTQSTQQAPAQPAPVPTSQTPDPHPSTQQSTPQPSQQASQQQTSAQSQQQAPQQQASNSQVPPTQQQPQQQPASSSDKPSIADPKHPDHKLYEQAMANLQQLGPSGGFKSQEELTKAAAAVAADARASGLNSIDHVAKTNTPNGQTLLVAVEGNPMNPASKNSYIDYGQATTQTVQQSTQMADATRTQQQATPTPTQQQENRMAVGAR
jgi:peptidoglycan hydrolase-like protein with peptidoglycan-binding domain